MGAVKLKINKILPISLFLFSFIFIFNVYANDLTIVANSSYVKANMWWEIDTSYNCVHIPLNYSFGNGNEFNIANYTGIGAKEDSQVSGVEIAPSGFYCIFFKYNYTIPLNLTGTQYNLSIDFNIKDSSVLNGNCQFWVWNYTNNSYSLIFEDADCVYGGDWLFGFNNWLINFTSTEKNDIIQNGKMFLLFKGGFQNDIATLVTHMDYVATIFHTPPLKCSAWNEELHYWVSYNPNDVLCIGGFQAFCNGANGLFNITSTPCIDIFLTINASLPIGYTNCGIFYPDLSTHQYANNTNVTISVYPICNFAYWLLDNGTTITDQIFSMFLAQNRTVTAVFNNSPVIQNSTVGGGAYLPTNYFGFNLSWMNPVFSGFFVLLLVNLAFPIITLIEFRQHDIKNGEVFSLGIFFLLFLVFLFGGFYPQILFIPLIFLVGIFFVYIGRSVFGGGN